MLRRSPHLPLALLMVLVLAVFAQVVGHDFLSYDDGFNVYANRRVTSLSFANLVSFWKAPYDNLYIPLTYNLWALLACLAGKLPAGDGGQLNAGVFHAANLLFHLGCAGVVYAILRLLVVRTWEAWAGAVIFALHPVQVEAVAWVTGLKDIFSAFWALVAIWQYLLYAKSGWGNRQSKLHYLLAGVCFSLAVLAKPGAVIVPLLVVVIGRLWLGRPWRLLAVEVLPLFLLAVPVVVMTKLSQPDGHQGWQPAFWQRFLIVADTLAFYLAKVFLPGSLGPDYGRMPEVVLQQPLPYWTLLFIAVAVVVVWRRRIGHPWLTAGKIFAVSLLPVLGFVSFDFQNISTVADRYLYLAMLGPAFAVACALARWRSKAVWLVFAVVAITLTGKTVMQTGHWRNSWRLTTHALSVNPASWVMHNNRGIELAKADSFEEAITAFERALAAKPDYAEAYNNLGAVYRQLLQNSDAIENFTKSLQLNPGNAKAAFNLAMIYAARKQRSLAIDYYRKAIAAKPDFLEAYNNLGLIYLELNRAQAALEVYQQAIASCPDHAQLHYNLARVYAELGSRPQSIAALHRATEIDPNFAPAYHQLYHAYRDLGDMAAAQVNGDRAQELGFQEDACTIKVSGRRN